MSYKTLSQTTQKLVVGLTRPTAEIIVNDLYEREYLIEENARVDSINAVYRQNQIISNLIITDYQKNEVNYLQIIANTEEEKELYKFDLKQEKKRSRNLKIQNVALKGLLGIGAVILGKELLFN